MRLRSSSHHDGLPLAPLRCIARVVGLAVLVIAAVCCRQANAGGFFHFSTDVTVGAPYNVGPAAAVSFPTVGGTNIDITAVAFAGPGNLNATGIGTDVPLAEIKVNVLLASPFEAVSIPFTFDMSVIDFPTGSSAIPDGSDVFTFSGTISGSIGAGLQVNLNTISPIVVPSKVIGGDIYTLTFTNNFYAAPGPFFEGRIGTHVTAVPVPEPGSLTLFALGTLVLATPALRRWRRTSRRLRI